MKINQLLVFMLPLFSLAYVGCGSSDSGSGNASSSQPVLPYCSNVQSYSSPLTITGSAQYAYRTDGNGAVATPRPIRYAEVRVLDASGNEIQCGETDATGNFSISLPNDGSTATIQVNSRSLNSQGNAYVLDNPTNNSFFSLTTSLTLNGSVTSVGTLTAQATGTLEGGAFNILDQIHNANEYLRNETGSCTATYSTCQEITTTPPLVTIYWSPGVNPGTYFGVSTGLSFYLPGESELYLLGGSNGDVDNSDTDHFDNSIILHEYAHFLEDIYSQTDSPGGAHNGNSIIDPRLAWGEGWANFFQAAITGSPVYRDTYGTTAGTNTGVFFNESLETPGNDIPSTTGEGNFREFSISRLLWDSIDTNNEGAGVDQVSGSFEELWAAFSSTTGGFASTTGSNVFRSMGLYHILRAALPGASDWSSMLTGEEQLAARTHYANTLTLGGACAAINIQAADISPAQPENGTFSNSNQFASNDFYQYTHVGGVLSVALNYTNTVPSDPTDLDLFIWSGSYTFGNESDALAFSNSTITAGQASGAESISASLPAGTYMINVHAFTGTRLGSAANYTLSIGGQNACPD